MIVDNYNYSVGESIANVLTHFLSIPFAAGAFYQLYHATNTFREAVVVSIYGSLLMALFLVSTIYHLVFALEVAQSCSRFCHKIRPWRHFLLAMDRAVVHLFIAGCYTPWLILRDHGPLGSQCTHWMLKVELLLTTLGMHMCQAMWIATITGIIIQHTRLISEVNRLIFVYIIAGILPGTFMVVFMTDSSGLPIIGLGGLAYITGLLFFFSDRSIPFAHAIWHVFVNLGVYLHYRAMHDYLLRERYSPMAKFLNGMLNLVNN